MASGIDPDNSAFLARAPQIASMRDARARLQPHILHTPVHRWAGPEIERRTARGTEIVLKLELFQRTGTFKIRGALLNVMNLSDSARARGVTGVSAGNHAIAVACAAQRLGSSAKVVMIETANPARVAAARAFGAEVVTAPDGPSAFAMVERIAAEEGRSFIHPFDGENVVLGTGTLGLEIMDAAPDLDAVIVAIGGGGLMSGVAAAVKQLNPACAVYGVEPAGADLMTRSLAAGAPQKLEAVRTIADSLAPPMTTPGAFALCRRFVDEVVTVTDDEITAAMALLFREMKLAVEPAGAAAAAALLGPLKDRLAGRRVAVLVCGSNIDSATFGSLIARGEAILDG